MDRVTAAVTLALSVAIAGCGGQSEVSNVEAPGMRHDLSSAPASGDGPGGGVQSPGSAADGMASGHTLSAEQFEAAVITPPDTLDGIDISGGAWRVIEVPGATSSPSIVRTPSGWMSLSNRFLGDDAKVPTGAESALYRSRDGIHWQRIPLDLASDNLRLEDLAYGAGRYVMVGVRNADEGVVWTSSDGEHWSESSQLLSGPNTLRTVTFVKDRFFAFGFLQLRSSSTGESWDALPTHLVQGGAGAYGNGRYLLLGNGPMQTSEDGRAWQEHSLDCNLPRACITNPSGGVAQGYHHFALFAEGRFFTEEISSPDGVSWDAESGLAPSTYIDGHFLGSSSVSAGLVTWRLGGPVQTLRVIRPSRAAVTAAGRKGEVLEHDAPLPETVEVPFEDGLTCESAACVLVNGWLLLVPPPGTPPLVDRVPRDAAGAPLLTDDCPVSSKIFCADYAARSGCYCNIGAPGSPDECDDVSQYRCAGQFSPRSAEWQLEELAQAGCSCDAVDPNEPPGFGRTCVAGENTCQSPLECLGIDTPVSAGPPEEQPFVCTSRCSVNADCPSWEAFGFCSGLVRLRCSGGTCQPRGCD